MGVADNKTYKDQYHFNDKWFRVKGEDYPSINDEDKINSTIKENPYRSNVEIEGKEVVLQPDLSALFKAVGKKHSQGGMDVLLKPNSFIFSDDKTLSFGENDHKLFELKEGGNFKPEKNTPAAVLKRNIDVKHYNTLVNNIKSNSKDDLTKKSSMMMLEKYIQTLGNVAYVQEEKKNFPQGVPEFAAGTAPVYDVQTKQDVMESKQFRKYGGEVTKYGPGGLTDGDRCPCGKDAQGNCIPCSPAQLQELLRKAPKGTLDQAKGMLKVGSIDNSDIYHLGTDASGKNISVPMGVPGGRMNDQWRKKMQSLIDQGATLDQLVQQKHGTREGLSKMFNFPVFSPGTDKLLAVTNTVGTPPATSINPPKQDVLTPEEVTGSGKGYKAVDWQFTPWQKISQAFGFGNFANVKRYMPFRSRYQATYMDPALLNEQQAVGTAKGITNTQISSLNTLNPILRNAQAATSYGQLLDQIPQIGMNVENQNTQIKNQSRQFNTQIKNQETQQNMQNDQQYYQQSVIGRQNFDNMRTFAGNQAMNNVLRDVESNQKLAYNQLTLNNPAYKFDFKTGNFLRNADKSIMDVQGRLPQDSWESMVDEVQKLKSSGLSDAVISSLVRGRFFQQAAPYFSQSNTPPPFKKGGKVKNPYK